MYIHFCACFCCWHCGTQQNIFILRMDVNHAHYRARIIYRNENILLDTCLFVYFQFVNGYDNTWKFGTETQQTFPVSNRMLIWFKENRFWHVHVLLCGVYENYDESQHSYRFKKMTFRFTRPSVVIVVALLFNFIQTTITPC